MWLVPSTHTNHIGANLSVTSEPTAYCKSCSNPDGTDGYRMYLDENSVCDERCVKVERKSYKLAQGYECGWCPDS
jgi:hypothetical protein